ncbi:MAG: DNRLRE domain-containing protein [candidate division KSB1 bacterium]|jgi:hypothetical protein|nr:DNRLRE domain-containing protein [candidate division KSB1 bacterium]
MKTLKMIPMIFVLSLLMTVTGHSQKKELVEKRTKYSKTYLNENGAYTTEISAGPVHYRNEQDLFVKIDRSVKAARAEDYDYEITSGLYHAYFKSNLHYEWPVVFETSEGANLKSQLIGMAFLDGAKKDYQVIESVKNNPPVVSGNEITYPDVFRGVDMVIKYEDQRLKEEILMSQQARMLLPDPAQYGLKSQTAYIVFITMLDLKGAPEIYGDNMKIRNLDFVSDHPIHFRDLKGDVKFFLPIDWAFHEEDRDSLDESRMLKIRRFLLHNEDGSFLLSGVKLKHLEKMKAGTIIFDPSTTLNTPDKCNDTFIAGDIYGYEERQNYNYGGADYLQIWNYGNAPTHQRRRSLLKFDLSGIAAEAEITEAKLKLYCYDVIDIDNGKSYPARIDVHKMLNAWDEGNANGTSGLTNWNARLDDGNQILNWGQSGGDYVETAVDFIRAESDGWLEWNILPLAEEWHVNPSGNYGVMVKLNNDEDTDVYQYFRFYSSEHGDDDFRPRLEISYTIGTIKTTYYIRDAAGNVIATYEK